MDRIPHPPSRVIHFRNVFTDVTQSDLVGLASPFGLVQGVVLLRTRNQALVQMQDLQAAVSFVQYYEATPASIRGRHIYCAFSEHQELKISQQTSDAPQNRILLVTILNAMYPITVDVLSQVFGPHGHIQKIVIFNKQAGLQALVQYANVDQAVAAKSALQNQNIYVGSCTLQIQYSNLSELTVKVNTERSRDFENPDLPPAMPAMHQRGPPPPQDMMSSPLSMHVPQSAYAQQPSPQHIHPGVMHQVAGMPTQQMAPQQIAPQQMAPSGMGLGAMGPAGMGPVGIGLAGMGPAGMGPPGMGAAGMSGQGMHPTQFMSAMSQAGVPTDRSVLLVSNLNEDRIDCDKLFNIFSCYGNVVRIKILHNKPDHALIQMGDNLQSMGAMQYLRDLVVYGKQLEVSFSKYSQLYPPDATNPSPKTKDYTMSKNNRYMRQNMRNFRNVCPPCATLHISNLQTAAESEVLDLFKPYGDIVHYKFFESSSRRQAFIQFADIERATTALIELHNAVCGTTNIRVAYAKSAQNLGAPPREFGAPLREPVPIESTQVGQSPMRIQKRPADEHAPPVSELLPLQAVALQAAVPPRPTAVETVLVPGPVRAAEDGSI